MLDISTPITVELNTTSSYLDLCKFIQNQLVEVGIQLDININPTLYTQTNGSDFKIRFF